MRVIDHEDVGEWAAVPQPRHDSRHRPKLVAPLAPVGVPVEQARQGGEHERRPGTGRSTEEHDASRHLEGESDARERRFLGRSAFDRLRQGMGHGRSLLRRRRHECQGLADHREADHLQSLLPGGAGGGVGTTDKEHRVVSQRRPLEVRAADRT